MSVFGFGGTNFHALLRAHWPGRDPVPQAGGALRLSRRGHDGWMLHSVFISFPFLRPHLQHASTLLGALYLSTARGTEEERAQQAVLTDTLILPPCCGGAQSGPR